MYREKLLHIWKSPVTADIFRWSKASHLPLLGISLLGLLISGGTLIVTLATKGLIDGASNHDSEKVTCYAALLVGTTVLMILCNTLRNLLRVRTNARLLGDLRCMMMHDLFQKEYTPLAGYHSGELVNRIFSDVTVVRDGIMGIIPRLTAMFVSFFGALIILVSMDWHFVILLIVGGCMGLILIIAFKKPMSERHKAMQEKEGKLHAILQEALGNLRLIKSGCSEERMETKIHKKQNAFYRMQLRRGYFSTGMNAAIGIVFQLSWLFCMLWGCRGIYKGLLTYGSLAAMIQLVGEVQEPIASAADIAAQTYATISSAERLKELLRLPEEEGTSVPGEELYKSFKGIQIRDMSFGYDRVPVFDRISTEIGRNEFIAVTGTSGGGKSTLFQLLMGIYKPSKGSVEFVFMDHTEPASKNTRPLFAYVPQGNILFSGSLRENLLMFTDSATEREIEDAVKTACIDDFLDTLKDGYETILGERGVGLSEGQAQRVAIARALLAHAPILLFDECTSALDEETEARLLTNLSQLKGKTCLIVTHRKAALKICGSGLHVGNGTVNKYMTL